MFPAVDLHAWVIYKRLGGKVLLRPAGLVISRFVVCFAESAELGQNSPQPHDYIQFRNLVNFTVGRQRASVAADEVAIYCPWIREEIYELNMCWGEDFWLKIAIHLSVLRKGFPWSRLRALGGVWIDVECNVVGEKLSEFFYPDQNGGESLEKVDWVGELLSEMLVVLLSDLLFNKWQSNSLAKMENNGRQNFDRYGNS